MAQPQAVMIVPCYNEAERLNTREFIRFVDEHPSYSFLFVDDGSLDQTSKILLSLQAERPGIFQALILEKNSGKAEAVRRGFLEAVKIGAPFIGFWDADLATPLEALPHFVRLTAERPQVEIVMGSRVKLLGHHIQRSLVRHYLGRVFATFASGVLDLEVYDTQCGAKLFRVTETFKRIIQEPFYSRWIFDVEILARYKKINRWSNREAENFIYELPLRTWHDVGGSKVKPADFLKAIGELAVIYRKYR